MLFSFLTFNVCGAQTIVDYNFPNNSSSWTPGTENPEGAFGQCTFEYAGTWQLKGGGLNISGDDGILTVTLPDGIYLAATDTILLTWSAQSNDKVHGPKITAAGNYVQGESSTKDEVKTEEFFVGDNDGCLNAVGVTSFTITRHGGKSVQLRRLRIGRGEEDAEPVAYEQITISSATTWDWTKASAGNAKVDLPNKTTDYVMANISGVTTDFTKFEARAIVLRGEQAVRNNDACQIEHIKIKFATSGHVKITFCNVGSAKGDRYLFINGENTGVYSVNTEAYDPKVVEKDIPEGEMVLTARKEGDDTNWAIRIMKIEYTPDEFYERDVTVGRYGSICIEKGSSRFEGATFYSLVKKVTDGVVVTGLYFDEVTVLEAGKPYIFLPTADKISLVLEGEEAEATHEKGLYGSFTQQSLTTSEGNPDLYILSNNQIRPTGKNCNVGEHRAYIKMSEVPDNAPAPAPGRRRVVLSTETTNTATELSYISVTDGEEIMYDILGRRINGPTANGIYIINGKKTIICK